VRIEGAWDFEQIFDRYFEKVYSYVAYRLAGDSELAKDVTQEVFLAALKALADFRGEGSVLTWLRSIARNKVADHFRALDAPHPPTPGSRADDTAIGLSPDEQRAVAVSLVMQQLPSSYAELLEEKYLEGLSVREIAKRKKMTEKAVESALSRARQAFRETFQKMQSSKEVADER